MYIFKICFTDQYWLAESDLQDLGLDPNLEWTLNPKSCTCILSAFQDSNPCTHVPVLKNTLNYGGHNEEENYYVIITLKKSALSWCATSKYVYDSVNKCFTLNFCGLDSISVIFTYSSFRIMTSLFIQYTWCLVLKGKSQNDWFI